MAGERFCGSREAMDEARKAIRSARLRDLACSMYPNASFCARTPKLTASDVMTRPSYTASLFLRNAIFSFFAQVAAQVF